jgi:putative phosphoribosyl transferase
MNTTELNILVHQGIMVKGTLNIPRHPESLVIFSHGSGSSRFSLRNRFVADVLNKNGIATLLSDLLTEGEDKVIENRFNINLLTQRLVKVTEHAAKLSVLKGLFLGYFGASTGAASALKAAAQLKDSIKAVVSRGGRPDLAKDALPKVKAPTLLIVGSLDKVVIELNESAFASMRCEKKLQVVEGATHLFEEAGKLEEVAHLAINWFTSYLQPNPILVK